MSENNIESLSPLEFTRLKPSVYCGNTDTPQQLIIELVSNAIDEHNIGNGNIIKVWINKDNSITVEDEGQGFPIGEKREDGDIFDNSNILIYNLGDLKNDEDLDKFAEMLETLMDVLFN